MTPHPASTHPRQTPSPLGSTTSTSALSQASNHSSSHLSSSWSHLSTGSDRPQIKSFGQGWLSAPANHDTTPTGPPLRARSPSMPVLPSHVRLQDVFSQSGAEEQAEQGTLEARMRGMRVSTFSPPSSFADYPEAHQEHHDVWAQSSPGFNFDPHSEDQLAPSFSDYHVKWPVPAPLMHHQSVPNLARATPKTRPGGQVRFSDDVFWDGSVDDEGDEVRGGRRPMVASKSMSSLAGSGKGANVYVNSLPADMTEERLREAAVAFGKVISVKVDMAFDPRHPDQYRRYGFVLFDSPSSAQSFINFLKARGHEAERGREDYVTTYKACEDQESSNLYIQGVPTTATAQEVEDLLAPYGTLASLKLLEDANKNRRGPIMARMQSRPQADAVIRALNNKPNSINGERLQVRIADSDEQKLLKKRASTLAYLDNTAAKKPILPQSPPHASIEDINRLQALAESHLQAYYAIQQRLAAHHSAFVDPSSTSGSIPFPAALCSPPYTPPPSRYHADSRHSSSTYSFSSDPPVTPFTPSLPLPLPLRRRPHFSAADLHFSSAGGAGGARETLSHARSSPELGENNPAKLLWPRD